MGPRDVLDWLASTDGFRTRMACRGWTDAMNLSENVGDAAISASYLAIATVLWFYVARRHLPEFRKVFAMFSCFIVSCATTHVAQVVCSYWPAYHLYVVVTHACAALSIATLVLLVPMTPKVMAIPRVAAIAAPLHRLQLEYRAMREALIRRLEQDPQLADEATRRVIDEIRAIAERVERV